MRYNDEQVTQTRRRMVEAAARVFRREGYAGAGVDALAAAAGVTSGAVYGQFGSKAALFSEVVRNGAARLAEGVREQQAAHGRLWLEALAEDYMSRRSRRDVEGSCGLSSLTPELARAEAETRRDFQKGLKQALEAMAEAMTEAPPIESRATALVVLALLTGGATLARACPDPKLGDEIAEAITAAVARLGPPARAKRAR